MANRKVSAKKRGNPSIKKSDSKNSVEKEFFRSIIRHAADAIVTIDERGTVETANLAAEELFGYSREEMIGQNVKMLMPSPDRDQHDKYLARYLETGEKHIIGTWREVTGQHKDGTRIQIQLGVREFVSDDRRMFSAILRDLTELHRIQSELEKKAEDLLELSTPVISLWEGILALPLVGTLDSRRAMNCIEMALSEFGNRQALVLIIDITGVPVVDTMVADHLIRLAASVRLMGGHCVLTGISPAIAISMNSLGIDLATLMTRATLAEGLKLAIQLTGGAKG